MTDRTGGCYIDVWRKTDFRGEKIRIGGPAEYPTLVFAEGQWGDDIGSLRVGPNAFVMAFRRRNFKDELVTFGPNDEVADLSQFEFEDDIESVKVIDSLKIFEHVGYNSSDEHAAPDAAAEDGVGGDAPAGTHKGRGRPGRKR